MYIYIYIQSSSNELSSLVSVIINVNKQIPLLALRLLMATRLCYQVEVKLTEFQSQLEASCMSSYNHEL